MKSIVAILIGAVAAINPARRGQSMGQWVELPNCPSKLSETDYPLMDDLTNATWATCKINNNRPARTIGHAQEDYIWSPTQIPSEALKTHEHQVDVYSEGKFMAYGAKYDGTHGDLNPPIDRSDKRFMKY